MKALKTTIYSLMIHKLLFLTLLFALSKLSRSGVFNPLLTQWHNKVLKYFIFILLPIYMYILQRAKNLQKKVKFHTTFASMFLYFFPQIAKLSHCFHTVSLICQHITPSISKKQNKLNSNFNLHIFLGGGGRVYLF